MRFMIKQKIFSFGDNFTINDEMGNPRYQVKGKVFSFGDKLRICDIQGNELVYIEQKLFKLLPEYTIYYNGNPAARVKREFTFFKPKFNIESLIGNYTIDGNFWGMDFNVVKEGRVVAQVSKKWFAFGDTYGVDISEDEDNAFILALVIVIDQVINDNNHNNG